MINYDVREQLPDEAIVFDNPSFDDSIVGYTEDDCSERFHMLANTSQ